MTFREHISKRERGARTVMVSAIALFYVHSANSIYSQSFVRIAEREVARRHFEDNYQFWEPDIGWTGNSAWGDPGTTSDAFRAAVLEQINYFRLHAGVQPVTEDLVYSAKAQQAALMVGVNAELNHFPPSTWKFYTSEGAEAAAHSNLALRANGIEAIEAYMDDGNNLTGPNCGHRNWLLRPETKTMGTGDVPAYGNYRANALWVITPENEMRATRSPWNCWPPANGYTPYELIYPLWSFRMPTGNLANATVTVSDIDGKNIDLQIVYQPSDSWDLLVWYIPNWNFQGPDQWFRVRITGITGATNSTVEYTVVGFDPATVPLRPATDLQVHTFSLEVMVTWSTPDVAAWTLWESVDFRSWRRVISRSDYDGFRAKMYVPNPGSRMFFKLSK